MSYRTWGATAQWMFSSRILTSVAMLAGLTLANMGSLPAQEPDETAPTSAAAKLNPANWSMPSFRLPDFLVRNDDQERIVERKNTLVGDIKTTASESWQRTKDTFNPARLNPMNLFAGDSNQSTDEKKPGFFSTLLAPMTPEPEERVATVNEFLNQDRP
ncbi:hypothetical protein [Allorhodopirellula solitaria]|nr:hypothetical protein [Allorhodopirellula solitaria]